MWLPWIDTWCTALSRPAKKNDEENDKSKKARFLVSLSLLVDSLILLADGGAAF